MVPKESEDVSIEVRGGEINAGDKRREGKEGVFSNVLGVDERDVTGTVEVIRESLLGISNGLGSILGMDFVEVVWEFGKRSKMARKMREDQLGEKFHLTAVIGLGFMLGILSFGSSCIAGGICITLFFFFLFFFVFLRTCLNLSKLI